MNKLATIDTKNAKLPVSYEHAKEALAACYKLDECKTWADKAAAIASYAKQSDDETLMKTAMRIKGRAIKRLGELVEEIEPKHPGRPVIGGTGATNSSEPVLTRKAVVEAAGVSKDQAVRALRVAAIPDEQFEAVIEADDPPTINQLASMGAEHRRAQKPQPEPESLAYLKGRTPDEFNAAIHARGAVRDLAQRCAKVAPEVVVVTSMDQNIAELKEWLAVVLPWLDTLHTEIYK